MNFWWGSRILSTWDLYAKMMIWGPYQQLNQMDRSYRIQDTSYRIQDTSYRIQDTGYKDTRMQERKDT